MTPVDEEGTQRFPASNLLDLPPRTREFLEDLRPEEIEALRLIVRMGPEGIKSVIGSVDFWRSVATVGKFMKWVLIVLFGTIAAGFVIIKDIVEGWEVVKGLWK